MSTLSSALFREQCRGGWKALSISPLSWPISFYFWVIHDCLLVFIYPVDDWLNSKQHSPKTVPDVKSKSVMSCLFVDHALVCILWVYQTLEVVQGEQYCTIHGAPRASISHLSLPRPIMGANIGSFIGMQVKCQSNAALCIQDTYSDDNDRIGGCLIWIFNNERIICSLIFRVREILHVCQVPSKVSVVMLFEFSFEYRMQSLF